MLIPTVVFGVRLCALAVRVGGGMYGSNAEEGRRRDWRERELRDREWELRDRELELELRDREWELE